MKYNFNVPLGSGVCPYAPQPKPILGSILGGAIGGLFGLAGNAQQAGFTKEQQKLQSKLNREEMAYSQGLQNNQQNWLMNTQYGKMVSGMKNAGLNPATANGTTPVTPSAGHPSTGGTGPAFHGEGLGSAVAQGVLAGKQVEMTDAQIDNIKADTKQKESNASNLDADTVIKQWQGSPRYQKLVENGLDSSAAQSWAAAGLSESQSFKCMAEIQQIGKEMELTDAQINKLQSESAKLLSDIDVNMSQIELNRAIAKAQKAAAAELMSRSALNTAQTGLVKAQTTTENATRQHVVNKLKSEGHLVESEASLNETETKIKDYMVSSMENIDPNSLEGKIYSRLDRIGDIAGKVIGAGASMYGAGKIGRGIAMQDHSRTVETQNVHIHNPKPRKK